MCCSAGLLSTARRGLAEGRAVVATGCVGPRPRARPRGCVSPCWPASGFGWAREPRPWHHPPPHGSSGEFRRSRPGRLPGERCIRHPPIVAHIGAFDLASYGDQVFPLVAAHELRRRLGDVELLPFSPMGSIGAPGGLGLGPWSASGPLSWRPVEPRALRRRRDRARRRQRSHALLRHRPRGRRRAAHRPLVHRGARRGRGRLPGRVARPGVPLELDPDTARRVRRRGRAGRGHGAGRGLPGRLEAAGVERAVEVVPDSAFLMPGAAPRAPGGPARRAALRQAACRPTGRWWWCRATTP